MKPFHSNSTRGKRALLSALALAAAGALVCGYAGLLLSYHHPAGLPSGPTIILFCGIWYVFSVLFGANSGILVKLLRKKHLKV